MFALLLRYSGFTHDVSAHAVVLPAVRGRRRHAAARQLIASSGEVGRRGAVHLLLDGGGHRGDGNKEPCGAQVTFQRTAAFPVILWRALRLAAQPRSTPELREREAALRQKIELLKRDRAAIGLPNPSPRTEEQTGLRSGQQAGARAKMADTKKGKPSLFYELISARVGPSTSSRSLEII